MEILAVPFAGLTLPGYLRLPVGVHQPPVVVAASRGPTRGRRSCSTWPITSSPGAGGRRLRRAGQGTVSFGAKPRPDQGGGGAGDHRRGGRAAGPGRRAGGVCGISYGGLFAIRTAAVDDRVGRLSPCPAGTAPAGRFAAMDDLTRPGQYQHHGPDPAANMAAMTVAGAVAKGDRAAAAGLRRERSGSPPLAGRADRRRVRRAGDHRDLSRRRAHPQLTSGTWPGRWWPTGSPTPSDRE